MPHDGKGSCGKSNFLCEKVALGEEVEMSGKSMTTEFLKECMADSLLALMRKKDFSKITINEIAAGAGVNRSTWFRNFETKNEALTFKLFTSWQRWAKEHELTERHLYTLDNAGDFFMFNFENRNVLKTIYGANMQSMIYEAFYQVMMPRFGADAQEYYETRFYANGLFGLLDEWVKRDFRETPEEMTAVFFRIVAALG